MHSKNNKIKIMSYTDVIFPVFHRIPGFLRKTFKIFIVEICVKTIQKLGVLGRDGRKLQMW